MTDKMMNGAENEALIYPVAYRLSAKKVGPSPLGDIFEVAYEEEFDSSISKERIRATAEAIRLAMPAKVCVSGRRIRIRLQANRETLANMMVSEFFSKSAFSRWSLGQLWEQAVAMTCQVAEDMRTRAP